MDNTQFGSRLDPAPRDLTAYERARLAKGLSWKEGESRIRRVTALFSEENDHLLKGTMCIFTHRSKCTRPA